MHNNVTRVKLEMGIDRLEVTFQCMLTWVSDSSEHSSNAWIVELLVWL